MSKLALLGGPKTISEEFIPYNPYGDEEVAAAVNVIKSGVLSKFLGSWSEDFYGGPKVREFERAWENYFSVKHAVAVNSATSGLIAAIGAAGIGPGDEVIVSPWTMSASATAILVWNGIPVFSDIEEDTFNLDPDSVVKNITARTRAILVTDIFGHAARLNEIMKIAKANGLKVIEDAAQAPGALYGGQFVGTVGDIGVYSLNYHKHIHTGEGGVCVTQDSGLAERMQLIRNHAEAVVGGKGVTDLSNMIGFNFRLGEIEAAMGIEQLKKLKRIVDRKSDLGSRLSSGLKVLKGLKTPIVKENATHVYYVYPLILDLEIIRVPRSRIVSALKAEGVPGLMEGYLNLHLLPMYQKKVAHGKFGSPWVKEVYQGEVSYQKGICPVSENMHENQMIGLLICLHDYTDRQIDLIIEAFKKVWTHLEDLK